MMRTKRTYGIAAVGIGVALVVSACGSSSSSSSKASTTSAAGASAGTSGSAAAGSGANAKIMVMGDFTSTIPFTLPEIVPTVKGVLRNMPNVQIETCDTKGTPAAFVTCSRQAQSDKVAAVILGFSAGAADQSLLTKAKIPVLDTADSTSPNSYPVSQSFALYTALGVGLGKQGCSKLGIVYLDGSDFLVDYIKQGFESTGGKEVARAAVAANAADLAPAVSKLTGAGAECVAVSLTPSGAAQALTALKQSGKQLKIGGISAIFTGQLIQSLGALTNGLYVVDQELNPDDSAPGIQQVAADEHAADSSAKVTQQAVGAWVSAKLVQATIAKLQGTATAASFTTALDSLRNVDMDGVIQPWSTIPLNSKAFPRIFNHYGINYVIQNGKPVRQGDFYDIAPILEKN